MKRRILIYGHDKSLLDTRAALVRSAGFDALSASNLNDVERLIEAEAIDALILCHTISPEEDEALLVKAWTVQPSMKALVLTANKRNGFVARDVPTVDVWNGPDAFIKKLRTLVAGPKSLSSDLPTSNCESGGFDEQREGTDAGRRGSRGW